MNRNWILCAPVAVFSAAGLFLIDCSSSSTTNVGPGASSGASSAATTASSTKASATSSATESTPSSMTSASGSSTSGAGSTSGSGGSTTSGGGYTGFTGPYTTASGAAAGDSPASCQPPDGGETCTPGTISCGTATCDLSKEFCCQATGDTCVPNGSPNSACPIATSTPITCDEAADCPAGEICCIATNNETNGTVSCQKPLAVDAGANPCPTAAIATAQICRSDNECGGKKCQQWICNQTVHIEACSNPVPALSGLCVVN